ncbi:hypothetical protein SCHPADRAFT_997573 [Schizopora paradoxa]|uniref:Uncharacterized protein n=1 Tax=Schizopora paradoxa TaxID=27342 RepID=A0A0H2RMN5_9AGAM|nr:hypothetical protein SCHPADRAFT_997573 [Schizopora paradoxa]
MDGLSLSLATLLALALESILFGLFCALVVVTLYILLDRGEWKSSKHRMAMAATMITMVLLGGAHVAIDIRRVVLAFIMQPEGRDELLNDVSSPLYIARTSTYVVQTFLGDAFIVYRAYVVTGKNKFSIPFSIICISASICISVLCGIKYSMASWSATVFDLTPWTIAYFVVTFVINLTCTIIISVRIWWTRRDAGRVSVTAYRHTSQALKIVVESGAAYSILLITLAVTYVSKSWSQYIVVDALVQAIGIVFTLILLRVSLGVAQESPFGLVNIPHSNHIEARQLHLSKHLEINMTITKDSFDDAPLESHSIRSGSSSSDTMLMVSEGSGSDVAYKEQLKLGDEAGAAQTVAGLEIEAKAVGQFTQN